MNICLPKEYEVADAAAADILYVADNMRQSDVDEVMASSGQTPIEALSESVKASQYAKTVRYHGVPFVIGGLVVLEQGFGVPWQLCTHQAPKHAKALVSMGKQGAVQWLEQCHTLGNYVDARNTTSLAWLKRIGFSFLDPIRIGPKSDLFIPAILKRPEVRVSTENQGNLGHSLGDV